jgi:hypothetical protein
MQTEDAKKRREYIEAKGLSKVIFGYDHGDVVCVQYHPKGIKGTCRGSVVQVASDMIFINNRRRHDARARQPRAGTEQSNTTQVALLTMARLRFGSQSLLSWHETERAPFAGGLCFATAARG